MLTDTLWAAMEPLVRQAKTHTGGRPPVLPDRLLFEALLYLGRTGIPLERLGLARRVRLAFPLLPALALRHQFPRPDHLPDLGDVFDEFARVVVKPVERERVFLGCAVGSDDLQDQQQEHPRRFDQPHIQPTHAIQGDDPWRTGTPVLESLRPDDEFDLPVAS